MMKNAINNEKNKTKAVALLSGGLDSRLAVKMMLDQGIDVIALNFTTCFCTCTAKSSCKTEAKKAAEEFGIELRVYNQTESLMEAVKKPKYGYGRGLNPCLDCRISMFKRAAQIMEEVGASFIITGEVLGERPMSQRLDAIKIVERDSNLAGKILRPLSAKLFEPTDIEKAGFVDREKLLAIQGRSRKPQIKYAEEFGLKDYPCPAGGCLLTERNYAKRLKDLLALRKDPTNKELNLLRVGRHFIIDNNLIVVGRDEAENKRIEILREADDVLLQCADFDGPSTIVKGENPSKEVLEKAGAITARYSQGREEDDLIINCQNHSVLEIKVTPKYGFSLTEDSVR